MAFHFKGVREYIDEAADAAGLVARDSDDDQRRSDVNAHRGKAREGPLLKAVVDALSQLPDQVRRAEAGLIDKDAPRQAMDRVKLFLTTMEVQFNGAKAAVADFEKHFDLGGFKPAPDPTPVDFKDLDADGNLVPTDDAKPPVKPANPKK